jgi:predicted Zn-dependent protease
MLAKLYSSRKDHTTAIKILDEGLKFSGREPLLLKAKAKLLLAANNIETACQVAQSLAEAIPSESNRIFFASCLMSAHRYQNAYDVLFQCLHDTTDRPKILKAMSEILRQMDCAAQALLVLQLAKTAAPPSVNSQFDELIHHLMLGVKQNRQLSSAKKAG